MLRNFIQFYNIYIKNLRQYFKNTCNAFDRRLQKIKKKKNKLRPWIKKEKLVYYNYFAGRIMIFPLLKFLAWHACCMKWDLCSLLYNRTLRF